MCFILNNTLPQGQGQGLGNGAETTDSSADNIALMSLLQRKSNWLTVENNDKSNKNSAPGMGKVHVHSIPISFSPIPCKPLYFDCAIKHIPIPANIHVRSGAVNKNKKDEETSSGIVGTAQSWLGGWFSSK